MLCLRTRRDRRDLRRPTTNGRGPIRPRGKKPEDRSSAIGPNPPRQETCGSRQAECVDRRFDV